MTMALHIKYSTWPEIGYILEIKTMIDNKKIVVVMPAYNAENTLKKTYGELPDIVDEVIIVDDNSNDNTQKVAEEIGARYIRHEKNMGYGGNQKTCYKVALGEGADIVIMVHPDYQYSPKLVHAMAAMLTSAHYDIVLASRIIGDQISRKLSMPRWRYLANRILTYFANILLNYKLSEYHTGYRAYSKEALDTLTFERFSNDFIFDNELLIQSIHRGLRIGEISCPTRYDTSSSSINLQRSIKYGFGVVALACRFRLNRIGIYNSSFFSNNMKNTAATEQ